MTDLLVNEYGYLFDGEEVFPLDAIDHDWRTPYPEFAAEAEFSWESGELGVLANIFRHAEIRDWVCDDDAWNVLHGIAPSDVKLLGRGHLGDKRMNIVQVVATVDVVNRDASYIKNYGSYEVVEFPAFYENSKNEVRSRIFRIPGSYISLFVGAEVKEALDRAGISGLAYTPITFAG